MEKRFFVYLLTTVTADLLSNFGEFKETTLQRNIRNKSEATLRICKEKMYSLKGFLSVLK